MATGTRMIAELVRLARPHHWIKNGFVILPVPFALTTAVEPDVGRFLVGLLGFSLLTSAVYVLNDIGDAEADRLSPFKRSRPLASGAVPIATAWVLSAALLAVGFGLCWRTGIRAVSFLALTYLLANLTYTLYLKHVALVDVFLLSSGYLIRVLLGCALVEVPPTSWLLVCTSALALFLSFTKRRADVAAGIDVEHRPVLARYSLEFLDQAMGITGGMTLFCYALYSLESGVLIEGRELAGLPFVAFAVLYYLLIAYTEGKGGSPVDLAYRSIPLQLCVLSWLAVTAWSLGFL